MFGSSRRPVLLTTLLVLLFVLLLQTTPTIHPGTKLNPELVIKSSQTKQTSVAIAGSKTPVHWTTLIRKSDISSNSYLTKLPKQAKNIKVQTISNQQALAILTAPALKPNIAMQDRKILARKPSPANSWLGSLSDAVESIIDQIASSFETPRNDETIIDLSEQIPSGQPVEPITLDSGDTNATDSGDSTNSSDPASTESSGEAQYVAVTYETPSPTITEQETTTGKTVTVSDSSLSSSDDSSGPAHLTDVLAFTNIPEIYKLGQEDKIKIKWKSNGDQPMEFHAYDLNNNGKLDYVEWTVPHLSDQVFEIIFISKAWHLDSNQNITEDIYDQVAVQEGTYEDNTFAVIPNNDFVRVTFQQTLTSSNDITVYAKPTESGTPSAIEVYPVYDGQEGAKLELVNDGTNPDFTNINEAAKYRILLTNLQTPTDVFDLRVIASGSEAISTNGIASSPEAPRNDGGIDIDYIVDPWTCGSTLTDTRDSKTYATVQIDDQCWMAANLNVGTKITGSGNQTNNSTLEKYCYNNDEVKCTTYGGLYQWDEMMQYAASCNGTGAPPNDKCSTPVQGICQTGWHVPSHYEWITLERAVCVSEGNSAGTCATRFPFDTTTTGELGSNEGNDLKSGGSTGFNGLLGGIILSNSSFFNLTYGYFWSSLESSSNAWFRYLFSGSGIVDRGKDWGKTPGFSVRCIMDPITNSAPTLTSISTTPATVKGGSTLTITPAGQADADSNDLYYYCNETGTAGGQAPTSENTLCTQEPTAYASASYASMTCSYTADTGNATRNAYCRAYDGTEYSDEQTTTYIVDSTSPTTTISSTNNGNSVTSTLTCNDGSAATYYCTDTTNTCAPATVYTTPVSYQITQTTYFRYYSTDAVSNQSSTGSDRVSAIEGQAAEPVRVAIPSPEGQTTTEIASSPEAPRNDEKQDPIEQIKQQIISLVAQLLGLFAEQVKQMGK